MTNVIIKNDFLTVTIALKGAEVRSVSNVNNQHEYMWSGNPDIWAGVSPTLFPVVGKTSDSVIRYQGKAYAQGNHGFARSSQFSISEQTEHKVTLVIITTELGDVYPFNLQFAVTYELLQNKLITTYAVKNLDNVPAFFSVGAHPAFRCPFDAEHTITDYALEFAHEENDLVWHEITPQAFFTGKTEHLTLQSLPLTHETFIDDAIVYNNYTSESIALKEKNSSRYIRVSLTGFPFLGLWSKVGAEYICIEPWCGHSDMLGFNGDVNQKRAIETVALHQNWVRSYTIEFGY